MYNSYPLPPVLQGCAPLKITFFSTTLNKVILGDFLNEKSIALLDNFLLVSSVVYF